MTAELRSSGSRRPGRGAHVAALVLAAGPWARAEAQADLAQRATAALDAAQRFLVAAQDQDGTWRSREYAALRDGVSLTGPALKVLLFAPTGADCGAAARRALDVFLERAPAASDGGEALVYPVYSAALASITLANVPGEEARRARDAWLALLLEHQLDEDLGWTPEDPSYGGFGYASTPPRRGDGGPFEADLSSTNFALGALRLCGFEAEDPVIRKALHFVARCQDAAHPADGGFVLSPTSSIQNKTGVADVDSQGRERCGAYGSATADGLRALLACGLAPDHPRVAAARAWLERSFRTDANPGEFSAARAAERHAVHYYWLWSAAHAFAALERRGVPVKVPWAREIAAAVLELQRDDGSWRNAYRLVKEDDPLVATPLAAGALGVALLRLQSRPSAAQAATACAAARRRSRRPPTELRRRIPRPPRTRAR